MKRTLTIIGMIALALCVVVIAFGAVTHHLYYRTRAADLPCRNCGGAARAVTVGGFDSDYREMGDC